MKLDSYSSVRALLKTLRGLLVSSASVFTVLSPACLGQTQDALAQSVADLRASAGGGLVRVLVTLRRVPGDLGEPSATKEGEENAKARVASAMREAGVALVEPVEGQPLLVMELAAKQFDELLATGLVCRIQEDRAERMH
jgi:hypothetical protein